MGQMVAACAGMFLSAGQEQKGGSDAGWVADGGNVAGGGGGHLYQPRRKSSGSVPKLNSPGIRSEKSQISRDRGLAWKA